LFGELQGMVAAHPSALAAEALSRAFGSGQPGVDHVPVGLVTLEGTQLDGALFTSRIVQGDTLNERANAAVALDLTLEALADPEAVKDDSFQPPDPFAGQARRTDPGEYDVTPLALEGAVNFLKAWRKNERSV
jgi:hypothetical protein